MLKECQKTDVLTESDRHRFDRQMMMDGWGEAGQCRLKHASVGVIGLGGLGSPITIYLAVAGVGKLILVDKDTVELSNLNRQILHWNPDVSQPKMHSAQAKLSEINPDIDIIAHEAELNACTIEGLLQGVDAVVDALDNFETRFLLNQYALSHSLPLFHGAVWGLEGRVTTIIPGRTACLRCIYRQVPPSEVFPVAGVTPAVVGSLQAMEVLKYFTGIGQLLENRLLIFDGERMEFHHMTLRQDPMCPVCGSA